MNRCMSITLIFLTAGALAAQTRPTTGPSTAPSALQPELAAMDKPLDQLTAQEAYDVAFQIWSRGEGSLSRQLLELMVRLHPDDQRLAFFHAASTRAYFNVTAATPQFARVLKLGSGTPEAWAAAVIIALDTRDGDSEMHFAVLRRVQASAPDDPLIHWMVGVQSRSLNRNLEDGAASYARLLEMVDPGPAIVHQTYANILDDLDRQELALRHRYIAVELEPSGWTYQGLANTFTNLKRYEEANAAFEQAVTFVPDRALYWRTWAQCLAKWGRDHNSPEKYQEAVKKALEALKHDPRDAIALNILGYSRSRLGDHEGAVEAWLRSIQLAPKAGWAYKQAMHDLHQLGRHDEALELQTRFHAMYPGASTQPAR